MRCLRHTPVPLMIFDANCVIISFFRSYWIPFRLEFIFLNLCKVFSIFLLHHLNTEEALVLILHSPLVLFSQLGLMVMIHHFRHEIIVNWTVLLIYKSKPGMLALKCLLMYWFLVRPELQNLRFDLIVLATRYIPHRSQWFKFGNLLSDGIIGLKQMWLVRWSFVSLVWSIYAIRVGLQHL